MCIPFTGRGDVEKKALSLLFSVVRFFTSLYLTRDSSDWFS